MSSQCAAEQERVKERGGHEDLLGVSDDDDDDDDDDDEVEQGRAPRSRKFRHGLSPEELRIHSLTHIPYHPGCKRCVAAQKQDHMHPRWESGLSKMQAELEAANGSSICADYVIPRDGPGDNGVTALAICDRDSLFLAGHVVDSKGTSAEHALGQVLRELPSRQSEGENRPRVINH